jgi:hypothetical protein
MQMQKTFGSQTNAKHPRTRTAMLRTVLSRALASRAPAVATRAGGFTSWRSTRQMGTADLGAEAEEGEFAPSDEIKFESSEPRYMTTLTFSEAGLQAMIKADINREKVRP